MTLLAAMSTVIAPGPAWWGALVGGVGVAACASTAVLARWRGTRLRRELAAARHELDRAGHARTRVANRTQHLLSGALATVAIRSRRARRLAESGHHRTALEIHDVEQTALRALSDVRDLLVQDRSRTLDEELTAVRATLATGGVRVTVSGATGEVHRVQRLGRAVEELLVLTVREAATNVLRHADGSYCRIWLAERNGTLGLDMVNDGAVPEPLGLPPLAGRCLADLAERAACLGGSLTTGPLPGGRYRLSLRLPLSPGGLGVFAPLLPADSRA